MTDTSHAQKIKLKTKKIYIDLKRIYGNTIKEEQKLSLL